MKKVVRRIRSKRKNVRYFLWSIKLLFSNSKTLVGVVILLLGVALLFVMRSVSFKTKSRAELYQSPSVAVAYANVDMSEAAGSMFSEGELSASILEKIIDPQNNLVDSSIHSTSLVIKQNVPVIIGISKQVVQEHCDGSKEDKIINGTLRCQFVEELATRDFKIAQESFEGTGKNLVLTKFDDVWDQTENLGCRTAPGGQSIPPLGCRAPIEKFIYVAYLYVEGAQKSGGRTWDHLAMVVAPGVFREAGGNYIDKWEEDGKTDADFMSSWVLTHELGHVFGQNHFSQLVEVKNYVEVLYRDGAIVHNVNVPVWYENDLYSWAHGGSFRSPLWARLITAWCDITTDIEECNDHTYSYVPKDVTFILKGIEGFDINNTIYILYADKLRVNNYLDEKSRVMASELQKTAEGRRSFTIYGVPTLLKDKDIFFGVIQIGEATKPRYFDFWFSRADLNVLFDRGETSMELQLRERTENEIKINEFKAPNEL